MAFNLLSRLIANPVDDKDEDVGSPVDDVEMKLMVKVMLILM